MFRTEFDNSDFDVSLMYAEFRGKMPNFKCQIFCPMFSYLLGFQFCLFSRDEVKLKESF